MSHKHLKLVAVIPAHNEAQAIAAVVGAVRNLGHDVLVIDDGSIDKTKDLAASAGAAVISTGKKSGKGCALRQGLNWAVGKGYDAVIAMDGDGQHDAADIRLFLECHRSTGASLINGNRMHYPKGMPLVRLATNGFMSGLISLICGQKVPDTQCGFRFISADVIKSVHLECSDFEIETEMLIKASRKGFKIMSVPIATIYRDEVSKIRPFRDTIRFIVFISRQLFKK